MPTNGGTSKSNSEKGPGGGGRTTFRPPWVKEGSQTTPVAPWSKRNSTTTTSETPSASATKENGQPEKQVKLQSREVKVPIMTERKKPVAEPLKPKEKLVKKDDDDDDEPVQERRSSKTIPFVLEKVPRKIEKELEKSNSTDEKLEKAGKFQRPVLKKVPKVDEIIKPEAPKVAPPVVQLKKVIKEPEKIVPVIKEDLRSNLVPIPPPPPPGSMGPPPPPMPPTAPPSDFVKKPISDKHKAMLEKLKSRPRKRPDWSDMMKEVESGKKLKHVECNDRSKPILTSKSITNIKGQYIYETEKANVHNALLKQIQFGIRLKPTKTNDRSKPVLEGLRKFRRQMTIEEQIQKSESRAQINLAEEAPVEESEDEMDDIDKLRDDLQSTKQMLALELRNKEAQERENKRLLAKIQNLEAELQREKSKDSSGTDVKTTSSTNSGADEKLVKSLKQEAEEAQKTSKLLEKKYEEAAEQLDSVKNEVEEKKRIIANLEKKLAQAAQGGGQAANDSRRQSEAAQKESSPEPEVEMSESEDDEDEEKKAERVARRLNREVKMLKTKLNRVKDKEKAAKKERSNLRSAMKKNQLILKEEHKKFKKLQKEVDKMADMMKEAASDEEEEEEEVEEEETEEETEEEDSDSEESEEETESESESEPEDAPDQDKKENYEPRIKRHEGRLNALKKGNYLLQANVDRLQDEINKMREKSVSLQADLDSVLSELG